MTQLDLDLSQLGRDRGIKRAAEHAGDPWMDTAVKSFVAFLKLHGPSTVEQFRYFWMSSGNAAPASHKAWGAMAMSAARQGLAVNTGRYVKAKSERTHAHPVPLWAAKS